MTGDRAKRSKFSDLWFRISDLAPKASAGVTLMELLVVLGVFSMTVTMVSAIFLQSNAVQRRTILVNDAQSDLRFVLEAMVREVRSGTIDYRFYEREGGIELPAERLVIQNPSGQQEAFFLSNDPSVCPSGVRGCVAMSVDGGAAESLTSSSLHVDRFAFYIAPRADPFTIDDASGDYPADTQPTVTVVIRGETAGVKPEDIVPLNAQTTVTSRTYVR